MISVLYSPLFKVVYLDGHSKCLGMLDMLIEAHSIRDIKANSSTGKLALLRLCIAFLSDIYKLRTIDDRSNLFHSKAFDRGLLTAYIDKCLSAGISFLLDDEQRPFMQAAFDSKLDAKSEKAVSRILFDVPAGNNHIHLDHRYESEHEIDAITAFEAMLETYLFCPASFAGASNVNNTPPIYAIVYGRNLFETLVLNMVSAYEISAVPYGEGEAAWEANEIIVPGTVKTEMSFIKALTWQPRRLTLCWDSDGKVRRVFLQNGYNFKGNDVWRDPHVVFHRDRAGNMIPLKPIIGRELWLDAGNLLNGSSTLLSPIPFRNLTRIWLDAPPVLEIELIGLYTNYAAVLGRVNECLKMPIELFEQTEKAQELQDSLGKVDEMARSLDSAVKWQYCRATEKKKKNVVASQAIDAFLYEMHKIIFGTFLDELIRGIPADERYAHFLKSMEYVLENNVLQGIIECTGFDVATLKRQDAVHAKVRKDFIELAGSVKKNE